MQNYTASFSSILVIAKILKTGFSERDNKYQSLTEFTSLLKFVASMPR